MALNIDASTRNSQLHFNRSMSLFAIRPILTHLTLCNVKVRAGFPGRGGVPGHCVNIALCIENEGVFLCTSW